MPEWQRGWRGYVYRPPPNPFLTTDYTHRAAQKERDKQLRIEAQERAKRKAKLMSEITVHWCEVNGWENGHAFSAKDPYAEQVVRRHKEKRVRGNSYGTPVYQDEEMTDEYYWVCGPHKVKFGLFQRGEQPKVIPPAKDREYDPDYVAKLERQLKDLERIQKETQTD